MRLKKNPKYITIETMEMNNNIQTETFNPFQPKDMNNVTRCGNISASFETITKEMAQFILNNYNHKNRRFSKSHWYLLAYNMKQSSFYINGDTIKFCEDGECMDGQHRLKAIASTGIPLTTLVVRGLPWKVMDTIDQALKSRSVADVLSLNDIKNAIYLGAGVDCYFSLFHNLSPMMSGNRESERSIDNQISIADKVGYIMENLSLMQELVAFSQKIYRQFPYLKIKTTLGYATYLINIKHHPIETEKKFFTSLAAMPSTTSTNAMTEWRRQMIASDPRKGKGNTITMAKRHAILAKTWNGYIQGKDYKKLSWTTNEGYINLI